MKIAALTEPLAVACHDVRRAELVAGDTAVVIGGGPIGLLVALVAQAAGAKVVVSEVNPQRLATARELDLDTIDPGAADVVERLHHLTDGAGADVVFEVSGSPAGALQMTELAFCEGASSSSRSSPSLSRSGCSTCSGRTPASWRESLRTGGLRARDRPGRRPLASPPADHGRRTARQAPRSVRRERARLLGDEDPRRLPLVNDEPYQGLFDLTGKTALVTGCRRGIGKAAATALAAAGADIVGLSTSLEDGGGEVGRAVTAYRRGFRGYRCDLADREATAAFLAELEHDVERIDVLVNNAGTIARSPAAEHADEIWDRVLEVNLRAPFVLTRELGKQMLARGTGKIIFVASLLSFQGGINVPSYAASKGGVAQLVKALANEWAARGVNVNAVAPGYIRTDPNTQALQDDPERHRQILERGPRPARWGEADDLAGAFVFLASRASDYVNGVVLPVDGGWLAR